MFAGVTMDWCISPKVAQPTGAAWCVSGFALIWRSNWVCRLRHSSFWRCRTIYWQLRRAVAWIWVTWVLAWLSLTHIPKVSTQIQQGVAVLDWWVRNADRTLTVHGGNANLLWHTSAQGGLVVIDHNLAFDKDFSEADFNALHVFSGAFKAVCSDMFLRQQWQEKLVAALNSWKTICATMPLSWTFADDEQTIPAETGLPDMLTTLQRCHLETFWNTAP